jgi:hypothetical protein
MPYKEHKEIDEIIRIHTDHEEGSWQRVPDPL